VGLTRYNLDRPVRLLTPAEAGRAIDQVERARARSMAERDGGWCYAADELFLMAGRSVPEADYYDEGALTENGVGAVRGFLNDFDRGLASVPRMDGRRIRLATAGSMAPFLRERASRLAAATGAEVEVVEVENRFFGPSVTVAGLLAGGDLVAALAPTTRADDLVLLPADALNADGLFIDSLPLTELEQALDPALVRAGSEITSTLCAS